MSQQSAMSQAFQLFISQAPEHAQAWLESVKKLGAASALEPKTAALAYLAVLAAARLEGGLAFHVKQAKVSGATREEVISAILIGLPAVGHTVMQSLPAALAAYDEA
jgi:alkylhydroperoxidase/carboxymuconolactone decarboxylase family protein YurZ